MSERFLVFLSNLDRDSENRYLCIAFFDNSTEEEYTMSSNPLFTLWLTVIAMLTLVLPGQSYGQRYIQPTDEELRLASELRNELTISLGLPTNTPEKRILLGTIRENRQVSCDALKSSKVIKVTAQCDWNTIYMTVLLRENEEILEAEKQSMTYAITLAARAVTTMRFERSSACNLPVDSDWEIIRLCELQKAFAEKKKNLSLDPNTPFELVYIIERVRNGNKNIQPPETGGDWLRIPLHNPKKILIKKFYIPPKETFCLLVFLLNI